MVLEDVTISHFHPSLIFEVNTLPFLDDKHILSYQDDINVLDYIADGFCTIKLYSHN
jgi:hypothetical protein